MTENDDLEQVIVTCRNVAVESDLQRFRFNRSWMACGSSRPSTAPAVGTLDLLAAFLARPYSKFGTVKHTTEVYNHGD